MDATVEGEVLVCPHCGSDATGTLEDATIWQRATFTAVHDGDGEETTAGGIEVVVVWESYDSEDVGDTETVGWFCRGCLTTWRKGDYSVTGDPSTVIAACPFVPESEVGQPPKTAPPLDPIRALDQLAGLLDGREWNVGDLETIADVLRRTGRTIGEPREAAASSSRAQASRWYVP